MVAIDATATNLHDVTPPETFALAAFCSFNASTSGESIADLAETQQNTESILGVAE